MKKKISVMLLVLAMGLSLNGCNKEPDVETNVSNENLENTEADYIEDEDDKSTDKEEQSVVDKDKEKKIAETVLCDSYNVWLADEKAQINNIYSVEDDKENYYIKQAELYSDRIYVIETDYNADERNDTLKVFDKDGQLLNSCILSTGSGFDFYMDRYMGTVYVVKDYYSYGNEGKPYQVEVYRYSFDNNEISLDERWSEVFSKLDKENISFGNSSNLFSVLNQKNDNLYGWFNSMSENNMIVILDPKTYEIVDSRYMNGSDGETWDWCRAICGDYVMVEDYDETIGGTYIVDLNNPENKYLIAFGDAYVQYMKYADGKIYFILTDYIRTNVASYTVEYFDTATGEIERVSSTMSRPTGGETYVYGASYGFGVCGNYAFYEEVITDGVYFTYATIDGQGEEKHSLIQKFDFSKYMSIEVESESIDNIYSHTPCYEYYVEKPVLNGNVNNADSINATLTEYFDRQIKSDIDMAQETSVDEEWGDYEMPPSSSEIVFMGMTNIGSHYIAFDMSYYDYPSGAAHGMGYTESMLFDTDTGIQINSVSEICGVDEETFKRIVAAKFVEDRYYLDNQAYYSGFEDDESEEEKQRLSREFFDEVYNDTSFDSWIILYTEDGISVGAPPYMYGPYASGTISVFVSYDELMMNME